MSTDKAPETETLYRRFHSRLKGFIAGRVSDDAAAADILQDVFLKIHSRIDTLADDTKLESWTYQIARNAIIDYYRSRKHTSELHEENHPADEEPEEETSDKLALSIRGMIEEMPEHYRDALLLTEYEGITQKELADRLGISLSGAKSRVQRARALLKDMLMRCCHFEFDSYGAIIDYHPIACCCCNEAGHA